MDLGVREWFLILGGLMIVGVLAHGAWIFVRARRRDLRMRYERNIPEVDVDDIELLRGELPSGGARVVSPAGRPEAGAPAAQRSSRDLNLDDQVPVLMDPIDRDLADAENAALRRHPAPAPTRPDQTDQAERVAAVDDPSSRADPEPRRPAREAPDGHEDDAADAGADTAAAAGRSGTDPAAAGVAQAGSAGDAPARPSATAAGEAPRGPEPDAEPRSPAARPARPEPPRREAAGAQADADDAPEMEQAPLFAGEPIVTRGEPRRRGAGRSDRDRSERPERGRGRTPARGKREAEPARPVDPPEEVIVINVLCRGDGRMAGPALLEVITDQGLRFGDMNIFHRHAAADRGRIEFSLASAVEPGTFDLGAMDEFETPGVTMFLTLPGPEQPLDSLEDMVAVARAIAGELGAELKDDKHSVMTGQTIEHCRQRIREFTRRQMSRRA